MKYLLCSLLTMVVVLGENCHKDAPTPVVPPDPNDTISEPVDSSLIHHVIDFGKSLVVKNGSVWNVPLKAYYNPSDSGVFYLMAYVQHPNQMEERLVIRDIPTLPGKYAYEYFPAASAGDNLIPEVSFFMVLEQDQLVGSFSLDTLSSLSNFIEVVRYDSVGHIIEGRFQATLENKAPDFPSIPDSISFTNGKFHLKIEHW